jgi:hypothetical protein
MAALRLLSAGLGTKETVFHRFVTWRRSPWGERSTQSLIIVASAQAIVAAGILAGLNLAFDSFSVGGTVFFAVFMFAVFLSGMLRQRKHGPTKPRTFFSKDPDDYR